MKLLCINNKEIVIDNIRFIPGGLEEDKDYVTRGKPFTSSSGQLCYYIEGIGKRLCCRFTELLEGENKAKIALNKLKREFELN